MSEAKATQEKKVRWSDRGEWCDRCGEAKAVWSGLCEPCHAIPPAPPNGIRVGGYTIKPFSHDSFWIENSIGEGMAIKTPELEALIARFFAEKF